jgi:hypothetical protein
VLHGESDDGGNEQRQGAVVEEDGDQHAVVRHPDSLPARCTDQDSCLEVNDGTTRTGKGAGPAARDDVSGDGDGGWASASAEGGVVHVGIADEDLVTVGRAGAQKDRDESASGDATVLALLGHEVIGAHADAANGSSQSETGYLTETCEGTDGALCVALLYGQAESADGSHSSSASSDTAVASGCAGGDATRPTQACDDGAYVAVARSHSDASQDRTDHSAEANEISDGAVVCVGGQDSTTGSCSGVGVSALHGESHSSLRLSRRPQRQLRRQRRRRSGARRAAAGSRRLATGHRGPARMP